MRISRRPTRAMRPLLGDRAKPFNHKRLSDTEKMTINIQTNDILHPVCIRIIDSARSKYNPCKLPPKFIAKF